MRIPLNAVLLCLTTTFSLNSWAGAHDPRALNADPLTAESQIAPLLEGLGDNHFKVTTKNPQSQIFFDQGLRLAYAFNHSEALRSFKESARLDPENAMAYWGWAMVLGPNLNLKMVPEVEPRAYKAIQLALSHKEKVTELEQGLINAMAKRYSDDDSVTRKELDIDYADAMEALVQKHPNNSDINTLYAASLMNIYGRDYWYADGSPKKRIIDAKGALESAIEINPRHAGALHYFIHLVESPHPNLAEKHADVIANLMPGAGHIVHMPSHIYMRVGRFTDSYNTNAKAAKADERYITQCQSQGIYPLIYYPHNVHFMAWSAMNQGRPAEALTAARKIVGKVPPGLSSNPRVWALYEKFLSQPMFVMVRFGLWDDMLKEPKPDSGSSLMTGVWHYGRALAFTHTGNLEKASEEATNLKSIIDKMEESHELKETTSYRLLTIADNIVDGEITFAKGDTFRGIAHLEQAVRIEDSIRYNEPPDWYFPVRHFLGAMLLDANAPREAEVVYAEDLRKNPENGYSLLGLKLALEMQGREEDALAFNERFNQAWRDATHDLKSSRF
ncbi:tetratricopeptide repeat protein [Thalassotalea litorea]|uniref:hypothetical protein n=1 Tax=Thalassotalea litorea TaxID=2020715 RepID=UPI003734E5CF